MPVKLAPAEPCLDQRMAGERTRLVELPELRNRTQVFRDRTQAGEVLASLLTKFAGGDALLLAVPAGGVPVAAVAAQTLALPLDVAVVSKITLPWNTEAGYGAVAFDGTVRLNQELIANLALGESVVANGVSVTRAKVSERLRRLRRDAPMPDLTQRLLIVVDDGLASGYTLAAAVAALRKQGARRVVVAVPTAHADAAQELARDVEALYCANVRDGRHFAVADAYEDWSDVPEEVAAEILRTTQASGRLA
jgi:predicted phosphoribosyltransferase